MRWHQLKSWKIPEGDIIIHCGDYTNSGKSDEVKGFVNFLSNLPHKYKISVAGKSSKNQIPNQIKILFQGNHDLNMLPFAKEKNEEEIKKMAKSIFGEIIYLQDSFVKINDLKIYGTPWM